MNRRKIIAGNWKMHKEYVEGRDLAHAILEGMRTNEHQVILCPPYIHLKNVANIIKDVKNVALGAQNCHESTQGAFTGEVSAPMLRSVGCHFVIVGHSERREFFGETDTLIAKKIDALLAENLLPIYCCGEKLEVREAGKHIALVTKQLKEALFHLSPEQMLKIVIAYEPVWAIGTGVTASPEQAQEMHKEIRAVIAKQFGEEVAEATRILYGGSVKPNNAKEIFHQPDVDGGLIGGASLAANDFVAIIHAAG